MQKVVLVLADASPTSRKLATLKRAFPSCTVLALQPAGLIELVTRAAPELETRS
jgi:hypothetical protein